MSASRPPEGHISAEERRKLLMSIGGISLAVVPTLAAILYLVVGLSFSEQSALYKAQVDNALYQRADLIKSDIAAIKDGLQQSLSDRSFEQNPASALQLIPGGRQFRIIPLSDMGVASLDPKDYGLSSLVLLDRVRKTFETGAIGFEIIKHKETSQLVAVGRFETPTQHGVAIATLHSHILARWMSAAPIGQFNLWQTFDDAPSIRISESAEFLPAGSGDPVKRTIEGTPYILGLDVDPSIVPSSPALPFLFWPLILLGLWASYWVLIYKRRADLEGDVKLILDTADLRDPLTLQHSELSPLALTVRQLASNNRSRMRRSGAAAIQPEQSQDITTREPQAPQSIASEWTTGIGAWVRLAQSETEAVEQNALKKLAVGVAGLAARSSAQSFVVSCLGGDREIRAKTCFIKALLSEGVDVIDVGHVPTPIAHMATHNGTSSGAALILQRDTKGRLTLGALYNRQWVEEGFWQKITALSYEHVATSSNGRSIKLTLEDDYCDRLSADMAMAENLRITVVCDSPITLSIAEQSLQKASCDVRCVCLERGFSDSEAQAHFGGYEADLHFVLNSCASRLTVFDAHGNRVRDDHIFMLISRDALARHPGSDVIIGYKGSRVLSSFVTSCGGASKMVNSAPNVLQREMTDSGAIIGGDCDGAFYLRDRWFGSDDAIYAGARLAEIVSNEGPLTDLIAALPETSLSVLPLSDKTPLHNALLVLLSDATSFAGARISQTDGIRVDFADSWAHIDDVLANDPTLRFEGDDDGCRGRLEELVADLLSQKYPELVLPTPLPTMTTSRSP